MFYDYESGCLITSPDGDVASGYQINEKIEDLERQVRTLTKQNQELKNIIGKAIHELKKGITFCKNDSQGVYEKCNIAIHREESILKILKENEKDKMILDKDMFDSLFPIGTIYYSYDKEQKFPYGEWEYRGCNSMAYFFKRIK